MVGSEGYTYLNMPEPVWDFFKDYLGDFRLINEQYLIDLASQDKPIILETPFADIPKGSTAFWEVKTMLKTLKYTYEAKKGPSNYDLLIPPK